MSEQGDRELDVWIATHLFGWRWVPWVREHREMILVPPAEAAQYRPEVVLLDLGERPQHEPSYHSNLPAYSSDIAAAWQVADQLRRQSPLIIRGGPQWRLECSHHFETGLSFPLALCRLAKQVGEAFPGFPELAQARAREEAL